MSLEINLREIVIILLLDMIRAFINISKGR